MKTRNPMRVVKNCGEAIHRGGFQWMAVLLFAVVFAACTVARAATEGDFNYETDSVTITITKYVGPGGAVTIPGTIAGLPVTSIGAFAFNGCTSLTRVTIPDSVTSIGEWAFAYCIGLTSVTIGNSVASIGMSALDGCTGLTSVFFKGDKPKTVGSYVFNRSTEVTVYYLPGTLGWQSTFAGRPAVLWDPVIPSVGVTANGFSFRITGTARIPVAVEGSAELVGGGWVPLQAASLTNGVFDFIDPGWANHAARFYRVRSP